MLRECVWQQGVQAEWIELWVAADVASRYLNARGPGTTVARALRCVHAMSWLERSWRRQLLVHAVHLWAQELPAQHALVVLSDFLPEFEVVLLGRVCRESTAGVCSTGCLHNMGYLWLDTLGGCEGLFSPVPSRWQRATNACSVSQTLLFNAWVAAAAHDWDVSLVYQATLLSSPLGMYVSHRLLELHAICLSWCSNKCNGKVSSVLCCRRRLPHRLVGCAIQGLVVWTTTRHCCLCFVEPASGMM